MTDGVVGQSQSQWHMEIGIGGDRERFGLRMPSLARISQTM